MISFQRQHLLLQLLAWNTYFIGSASSCGVSEELIRQRRRELQQEQLPFLDELQTDGSSAALTDPPSINPQLLFDGILLNDLGAPIENAQVQFWHADSNGNYFHPGDDLDGFEYETDTFSYFGTATTSNDGSFTFRTYRPGIYLSRPITHIHFKVFNNGTELLTSQFYFSDENVGRFFDEMLILDLQDGVDENGNAVKTTQKDIVVNMGNGGSVKRTPRGVEGPYYPVVDFFDAGPDLTLGMNSNVMDEKSSDASGISAVAVFSAAGSFPRRLLLLTSSLCASAFFLF